MVDMINPGATKEIVGDDNIRAQKFARSIEQLQYEYDCVIVPVVTIVGNKINPGWQIGVLPRNAGMKEAANNPAGAPAGAPKASGPPSLNEFVAGPSGAPTPKAPMGPRMPLRTVGPRREVPQAPRQEESQQRADENEDPGNMPERA